MVARNAALAGIHAKGLVLNPVFAIGVVEIA